MNQKTKTIINNRATPLEAPAAWIGLDWGDKEHAFVLQEPTGAPEHGRIEHSAENLHAWLRELEVRFGGRPVFIGIEASRGAVIHALLRYAWMRIYPINPATSVRYRTAFKPSGAKDDLPDAEMLLELVRLHGQKLRPLEPQDECTVKLGGLVEARRKLVDRRTAVLNELTSLLKSYYPQALQLAGKLNSELAISFLRRWPDLIAVKAARPATVKRFYYMHQVRSAKLVSERLELIAKAVALTTDEARVSVAQMQLEELLDRLEVLQKHVHRFDQEISRTFAAHPNAGLFRELPGAGPQLAARLCVAFGTVRPAYPDPGSLQKYAGIAPVREKSGGQLWTHWRWRAPKFLRQTFVEWAGQTVRYSVWARAFYHHMLQRGKKHAMIIRALAFKWIRVLWRCWYENVPYNETFYLQQLIRRKSSHAVTP